MEKKLNGKMTNEEIIDKPKRKTRKDKGTKRRHYTMRQRQARSDNKRLNDIAKDVKKFEQMELSFDELKSSSGERKKAKRLQLIPNPRICPHCNKPKLLSKQWVITKEFIGCKSCLWNLKIIPKSKETSNGVPSSNPNQTLGQVNKDL